MPNIVNIGIVGTGDQAENHLKALQLLEERPAEGVGPVKVVGVFDIRLGVAVSVAQRYGVKPYDSLAALGADCDVLVNVTGNAAHLPVALEALDYADLVTEKPIAVSLAGCDQIRQKAEQLRRTVRAAYGWPDRLAWPREIVRSGALGPIHFASLRFSFADGMPGEEKKDWWVKGQGGSNKDLTGHTKAALMSLLDVSPIDVSAEMDNQAGVDRWGSAYQADVTTTALTRYDDGLLAELLVSHFDGEPLPKKKLWINLFGELGSLEIKLFDEGDTRPFKPVLRLDGAEPVFGPAPLTYIEGLTEMHRNMVRARVGLEPLNLSLVDAIAAEREVHAIARSVDENGGDWTEVYGS